LCCCWTSPAPPPHPPKSRGRLSTVWPPKRPGVSSPNSFSSPLNWGGLLSRPGFAPNLVVQALPELRMELLRSSKRAGSAPKNPIAPQSLDPRCRPRPRGPGERLVPPTRPAQILPRSGRRPCPPVLIPPYVPISRLWGVRFWPPPCPKRRQPSSLRRLGRRKPRGASRGPAGSPRRSVVVAASIPTITSPKTPVFHSPPAPSTPNEPVFMGPFFKRGRLVFFGPPKGHKIGSRVAPHRTCPGALRVILPLLPRGAEGKVPVTVEL